MPRGMRRRKLLRPQMARVKQVSGKYLARGWQVFGRCFPRGCHTFSSFVFRLIFDKNRRTIEYQSNNNRISSDADTALTRLNCLPKACLKLETVNVIPLRLLVVSIVTHSLTGLGHCRISDFFGISKKSLSNNLLILDFLYFCE